MKSTERKAIQSVTITLDENRIKLIKKQLKLKMEKEALYNQIQGTTHHGTLKKLIQGWDDIRSRQIGECEALVYILNELIESAPLDPD